MKRLTIGTLCAFFSMAAMAQSVDTDTVASHELDEVVVEARNAILGSEVSTYIPTSKQKNAAQTATDLLNRMAIPQLRMSPGGEVTDLAGKSVDIFIDFVPAAKEDLDGMRTTDVKKVEYYDYPADPRFQGKAHVINFVMQKYEYGGYVKAMASETIPTAGQLSLYGRLQYKRMMFDIASSAYNADFGHTGADTYETFRLPQEDGSVKEFERTSLQDNSRSKRQLYWPTLKARYSTDKITLQNTLGASFDRTPVTETGGSITYSPVIAPGTSYTQSSTNSSNSVSYSGYWSFILNDKNSITFSPSYAYTHTHSSSLFTEEGAGDFYNAANDNSHQFRGNLTYAHSFGEGGNLSVLLQSAGAFNSTRYSGTAETADHASTYRFGPGVKYSLSKGKVYGSAGAGVNWDRQIYMNFLDNSAAPWVDFSLQYAPTDSHSVRGEFHKSTNTPSSSYRSAAVIQSNPLMSYTGNPDLVSYRSYDVSLSYTYIPNNHLTLGTMGWGWIVKDRFVYDYQPTPTGILRTIRQPGGAYSQWSYGGYAMLRLFEGRLQLTGQLFASSVHNGEPYNFNKTAIDCALQAQLYLGNWTFSGIYYSPRAYPDGCMVGTWMKTKAYCLLQAGWANASWNFQLMFFNFNRWNWKSDRSVMHSPFYDKIEQTYSTNDHAMVKLSVTYTFGFGKKIERGNEASQQSGAASGILK